MAFEFDRDSLWRDVGYVPHPKQRTYHDSEARFRAAICGRRFGKSAMAAHDKIPNLLNPTIKERGWIVAPTYSLGEYEFRYLWEAIIQKLGLGKQIKRKAYNVRSGEMFIVMPWGSSIEVKSADHPDGLVGEGLDWVILAEAAKMPSAVWEKYIRPALADRKGKADFVSTPEGYNWLYQLVTSKEPELELFHFPSWENPHVYPEGREDPEIKALERVQSHAWFAQEIGAEFTSFVGLIFEEFTEDVHVIDYEYNPDIPNYLAFDFGYTNPFVCLDIQVTPSDEVYIWREYYVTHLATHKHAEALLKRDDPPGYHVVFGTGDAADPGAISTLEDYGVCKMLADPKSKDVTLGIEEVKKLLKPDNPRLFVAKQCEKTKWEFHNYRTKGARSQDDNKNQNEKPHQYADHAMDAIRYFAMHRFHLGAGYHLRDLMSYSYQQKQTPYVKYPELYEPERQGPGHFTLTGGML